MRPLPCLIAAVTLAASAIVAQAAPVGYGEAFDMLYKVDAGARQAQEIGGAGRIAGRPAANISGLTTTKDGGLLAVTAGSDFKQLIRIDPASGAASSVGSLGLAGQGAGQYDALDLNMAAACAGDLWLTSASAGKLWRVNPANGETRLVGPTGHVVTGLVERDGVLYGAGGKGENLFYRLDPASGQATPVGPLGPDGWINSISLAFDADGTLWAVVNYVPPRTGQEIPAMWNDLATIDPATGKMTIHGPLTGPESLREIGMRGFTLGPPQCGAVAASARPVPVRSPWALGLLGLLLAGLAARHGAQRKGPR